MSEATPETAVPEASGHSANATRNSILYLVGALAQGVGVFLFQPFALHLLNSDSQWQELFLSISVIQVGVILAAAGLPLAITKAWFDPDGAAKARAISGFLGLGGIILGVGAAVIYSAVTGTLSHPGSFAIALVAMGFQSCVLGAQAILRAQGRAVMFVVLSLTSSMVAYAGGLVAMLLFGSRATVFMAGYAVMVVLSALLSVAVARPAMPFSHEGAVKEAIAVGLPALPHTGALMLLTQGAPFLLAALAAPGVSGNYGKVQIFVLGTVTLLGALNNVWVPSLMAVRGPARVERMRSTMKVAVAAAVAVTVIAASGANLVVHLMAGGRTELIPVAQVMPLLAMGYVLYLNASTLLFADGVTWWLSVVTPAVLVVSIGLAWWPAVHGDLVGVAVSSVVSFLLLGLAYLLVAGKRAAGGWPMGVFLLGCAVVLIYVGGLRLLPTDLLTGLLTVALVTALIVGGVLFKLSRVRRAARATSAGKDGSDV
ncbi:MULTISPECIES: hypothetical protein [Arthrobacter]|uniref:Membrane protein involved in the export of O-antigen and teichoic acid n=2 Tax=Arthrobacter TaxID=1663 RepID=A0ABU9KJW9_9MICC|nr:hypothetical protein [Arthrobacter sp. YJM1]MDP5227251.1 hypothetical protein [Arthrobacter sp. YJM1]